MTVDLEVIESICARNDVALLRVFGSAVRGEDTAQSDLDLLVDFSEPKSLLDLIGLQQEFEEALGRRVDLVTPASLSPYIRDQVVREAQVLYERAA
ncbi:MAG: nucleotidyltransferase family protein [Thioalkalivibrio sp.]|nr:nucleotidyltransferase family protein [Thioalkalivibrio sp.]